MRGPITMARDMLGMPRLLSTTMRQLDELAERVEFVRRELFFEMKYGRSERLAKQEARPVPRIVNPARVTDNRPHLRLNVGCGHVALDGYVNVDMREIPDVDVVASVDDLPFDDGTVMEIRSSHVLEHFPEEMTKRSILPHWRSKLGSGGTVVAIVPDGAAMLRAVSDGSCSFADFREVLFGAQDYEGDFHYNMFTPESMTLMLRDAGFEDVTVPASARRNGKCFEFEIRATRR